MNQLRSIYPASEQKAVEQELEKLKPEHPYRRVMRQTKDGRSIVCMVANNQPKSLESFLVCFWERVDRQGPDDCWKWLGPVKNTGYGRLCVGGKDATAHRVSFLINKGAIPEGLCVIHSCDNPICVNPHHLRTGTHYENMVDIDTHQRRIRGDRHPNRKLSEKDIPHIRSARANRESLKTIAVRYGVNRATICDVVKGRTWQWLT